MKHSLTAAILALSFVVTPAFSMGMDMSSLTPVLTYPDPQPEPVTKNASGIDK